MSNPMAHIRSINSEFQAGGGTRLEEITLSDGSILVIGEMSICLYADSKALTDGQSLWEASRADDSPWAAVTKTPVASLGWSELLRRFRKSRTLAPNLAAHSDDVAHENVPGFAYAWNLVIELTACGQFMLTLGRDSYTGSLEDLEVRLFEWAMNEGIAIKLEIP